MGDKGWLCVICGHFIEFAHQGKLLDEGGRVHHYCEEAEKSGIELERERIIELLESKLCWCVGQPLNEDNSKEELMKHMNCDWQAMMIEYHVALIKGEQK